MAEGGRLLEVCVDDVRGLADAVAGGADRIELCAALALGGLTPSFGLITAAAAAAIRVHVMIRSHAGDFRLQSDDLDIMQRDIDAVRGAGLAGVVFGASLNSGALDIAALRRLVEHATGLDLTLHRAFDLTPDPNEAVDAAIELGFHRILTSGRQSSALAGVDEIAAMVARASGRIAIMPGGGVNRDSVADIVQQTRAREVHASCSVSEPTAGQVHALGFAPLETRTTSRQVVAELAHVLKNLAP